VVVRRVVDPVAISGGGTEVVRECLTRAVVTAFGYVLLELVEVGLLSVVGDRGCLGDRVDLHLGDTRLVFEVGGDFVLFRRELHASHGQNRGLELRGIG